MLLEVVYWSDDIMWWFIFVIVTAQDGYLFDIPKFETEIECRTFVKQAGWNLNSYVNQKYENPDEKVNTILCISEEEYKKMQKIMKGIEI